MWTHQAELEWIREIHTWRTPLSDLFFIGCNFFDTVYFFLLLIPCIWLFFNRKLAAKLAIIFILNAVINHWLKQLFALPRPFMLDPDLGIITSSSPGFPNGAAQSAVLMCGIIIKEWKSDWKWIAGPLYLIVICFSRVYLGMHFPTDIIGGLIVGFFLLCIYLKLDLIKFGALSMATVSLLATLPLESAIYTNREIEVRVPSRQLAPGSLEILSEDKNYSQWTDDDHETSYRVMRSVAHHWESNPFLIYGNEQIGQNEPFRWEAVPYHLTNNPFSRYWQQFKVAINVIFGGKTISSEKQESLEQEYKDVIIEQASLVTEAVKNTDAFRNSDVIDRQQVLEGERVRVLYNYAPIGDEHFLIVSKDHRRDFRELTQEEYVEAAKISQFVIKRLKETQPIRHTYLFHKTGVDAGQTVPHWHMHLVFTNSPRNDCIGKIRWLWQMTFGSKPLNKEVLAQKVQYYKNVFNISANEENDK